MPAMVPGTVLNSLVRNKVYPAPDYGLNNKKTQKLIPDLNEAGRDFYTYWFRTEFALPPAYKGKTVWLFDQTDMAKAKKTIGTVACIQGNVPLSLLCAGTPEETAAYVRNLIEVAGEGGGYIVDFGAVADSGKDENIQAVVDTVMEYGRY